MSNQNAMSKKLSFANIAVAPRFSTDPGCFHIKKLVRKPLRFTV